MINQENQENVKSSIEGNGLSKSEHKWLTDQFESIEAYQEEQLKVLDAINGKLTFFAVLTIIGLVLGLLSILRGCAGL
jgi:hypothetical protein